MYHMTSVNKLHKNGTNDSFFFPGFVKRVMKYMYKGSEACQDFISILSVFFKEKYITAMALKIIFRAPHCS